MDLTEFVRTYAPDAPVIEPGDGGRTKIVIKHGRFAAMIEVVGLRDHLSIDVHSFVDGEQARGGVFGMEEGVRTTFPDAEAPGTSHRWPATRMVTVMVGEQS